MSKVTLKGHITVPKDQIEDVQKELIEHIRLTREEPGCLLFNVIQRQDDLLVFDVYEEFVDRAAFDSHQSRVKTSKWGMVTKDVERDYTIAET